MDDERNRKIVATAPSPSCPAPVATAPSPSTLAPVATTPSPSDAGFATCFPGRNLVVDKTFRGNHMPHWNVDGAIYHVSFRLADSVPQEKLQEWQEARMDFRRRQLNGEQIPAEDVCEFKRLYSENIEKYLDSGFGSCILRNDGALAVVRAALLHGDGVDYRLHAYGIMPNHVHVGFALRPGGELSQVVQAWKSVSSHRINRLLGRKGPVWQVDYYNHVIRTAEEYRAQMNYIARNDGVEAWRAGVDGEGAVATGAGVVGEGAVATGAGHDGEGAVATGAGVDGEGAVATAGAKSYEH